MSAQYQYVIVTGSGASEEFDPLLPPELDELLEPELELELELELEPEFDPELEPEPHAATPKHNNTTVIMIKNFFTVPFPLS